MPAVHHRDILALSAIFRPTDVLSGLYLPGSGLLFTLGPLGARCYFVLNGDGKTAIEPIEYFLQPTLIRLGLLGASDHRTRLARFHSTESGTSRSSAIHLAVLRYGGHHRWMERVWVRNRGRPGTRAFGTQCGADGDDIHNPLGHWQTSRACA